MCYKHTCYVFFIQTFWKYHLLKLNNKELLWYQDWPLMYALHPQKTISHLSPVSFPWSHAFTKTSTRSQNNAAPCASACIISGSVSTYVKVIYIYGVITVPIVVILHFCYVFLSERCNVWPNSCVLFSSKQCCLCFHPKQCSSESTVLQVGWFAGRLVVTGH